MMLKNRWKKAACLILTIISTVCLGKVDVKAADYWPDAPETLSPGVILMEESTGTILYEKNSDEAHYPASITKIMTSLLTLENSSPSDVVTFTEAEAHGIETGSSSMYCVPGEKFTIEHAGILAGTLATMRDEMDRWELLYSYAVALHSYAGFAAATEYGEKSVIATDLIDLIGPAMELATKDALDDLGIMDEGLDD